MELLLQGPWLGIEVGNQGSRKNSNSHIDASHSRQPLVKGERLVRYEVNAVMPLIDLTLVQGLRADATHRSSCASLRAQRAHGRGRDGATAPRRPGATAPLGHGAVGPWGHARRRSLLAPALALRASREILLWMTPSEAPKALRASECSELLDPTGASCWIFAQR